MSGMPANQSHVQNEAGLTRHDFIRSCATLAACIWLSACAGGSGLPAATSPFGASSISTGTVPAGAASSGTGILSRVERQLDCRRINGRMQVRILQIRDRLGNNAGLFESIGDSLASWVASSDRLDPASQRDVAQLQAYNTVLARKDCPTFDLEAELKPHPITHTPRPRRADESSSQN